MTEEVRHFKMDILEISSFDKDEDMELSLGNQPNYENEAFIYLNKNQVIKLMEFLQSQLEKLNETN